MEHRDSAMTAYEPTHLARGPLFLLQYAEQLGMDRKALMARVGLTPRMVEDPDARIKYSYMLQLWRAILDGREGEPIGLRAACQVHATDLGIVGYAMSYSENLLQAYERMARYGRVLSEAVGYEVHRHGEQVVLSPRTDPSLLGVWHPIVAELTLLLNIGREVTKKTLDPIEVHLPPPQPARLAEYRELFRCPIRFDRPQAALVFSASQMRLPIEASDPTLSGYLEQLAGHVLKSLHTPPETFVDRVRRATWHQLSSGKPELSRIAKQLHISPRTLQRRLRESGTSFSQLLDDLRRELSGRFLLDRKLAVSEVAFLLGYSEPSAFQRAFRRWQGRSPRQYRAG